MEVARKVELELHTADLRYFNLCVRSHATQGKSDVENPDLGFHRE